MSQHDIFMYLKDKGIHLSSYRGRSILPLFLINPIHIFYPFFVFYIFIYNMPDSYTKKKNSRQSRLQRNVQVFNSSIPLPTLFQRLHDSHNNRFLPVYFCCNRWRKHLCRSSSSLFLAFPALYLVHFD